LSSDDFLYQSETLEIKQLTKKTYQHTSYIGIPGYGKFPCNGLLLIDNGEAIVFDTPITDSVSVELIQWIEKQQNAKIKGVVINHFHNDCLGGLAAFHERNIPSYASDLTIELAGKNGETLPQNGFQGVLTLAANGTVSITQYHGAGHTLDNVVSYVPSEQVLFGGCLIKSLNARKGNLADADTLAWSATVQSVKAAYPETKIVVPGHGASGTTALLDYTINLFRQED
jgi:metallo-beta-lactamase class B